MSAARTATAVLKVLMRFDGLSNPVFFRQCKRSYLMCNSTDIDLMNRLLNYFHL